MLRKEGMRNIYVVLILRMLLVYAVYAVTRLLFYLFNLNLFADVTFSELVRMFVGGLKFDTSAIIYTNILVIALHILPFKFRYHKTYQRVVSGIFYFVNILAIIANMVDTVYYRFTMRRTTTAVFAEFKNEENGGTLFFRFMWDYWYVTLSVLLLSTLLVVVYRRIKVGKPLFKTPYVYYPVNIVCSAIIVGLCIGGMRGGFAHSVRPITLSNAAEYIDKPEHRGIVLNTPFSLIRTIGKTTLQKKTYFTQEQLDSLFTPVYKATADSTSRFGTMKGRNVVVILLESFGREYVGGFNRNVPGYEGGYTPYLDSLAQHAYVFERAFANGHKSIDAMPSALTSIPGMETPFILSHYSGNKINSPASLLAPEGYHTSFFHGAPNGSMGFNAFVKQAGYQEYYGKDEYNNDADFDGIWGIWDEPFLAYMAKTLNTMPQPFVSGVFTLSSHHPFKVPAHYEGKFPKGSLPIHQCVGYTDNALRNFFRVASTMPWFKNTVFVLTADHATTNYEKAYATSLGTFAIPMIVYAPGTDLQGYDDTTVVSQSDILPTVMSLLGYEKPFVTYGHNMFAPQEAHFMVNHIDGVFQMVEGDYTLQYSNEKTIGLYNYKKDYLLKQNLAGQLPELQKHMEDIVKAVVQQYNDGMLDNKLAL